MAKTELIQVRLSMSGGRATGREARYAATGIRSVGVAAGQASLGMRAFTGASALARRGLLAFGRILKTSVIGAVVAMAIEIPRMVSAYRESWKVGRATNQVIKTTGGVANVTAQHLADLANTLSMQTGVDDELIQSAGNLLLTFRNVRNEAGKGNDIFDQTLRVTQDLATATGTDLTNAVKQVGKAMHDPAVGLTALRRSGVSFSESQSDMINKLFESGKQLKAQKLIIRELNSEFAGQARVAADPFDKLSVAFENLEEEGGKILFPFLSKAANSLATFFNQMRTGRGFGGDVVAFFKRVGKAVGAATRAIGRFINSASFQDFAGAIVDFGRATVPVFRFFGKVASKAVGGVIRLMRGMVQVIKGVFQVLTAILTLDFAKAWQGAKNIVSGGVKGLIGTVTILSAPFRAVFAGIANLIRKTLGPVFDWIIDKIEWAVEQIDNITAALPGQSTDLSGLVTEVQNFNATHSGGGNGNGGGPSSSTPDRSPKPIKSIGHKLRGGAQTIIVPVNLDGKQIAEVVADRAADAAARA